MNALQWFYEIPISVFLLSTILTGILSKIPGFLPDHPNVRSSHRTVVARGGGIAFVLPSIAFLFVSLFVFDPISSPPLLGLIAGGAIFALLGLIDDIRSVSASIRLLLQFVLSYSIAHFCLAESIELFGSVVIHGTALHFFQAFWITSVVNFYNFMDGIDGIASFQGIFIAAVAGIVLWIDCNWMPPSNDPTLQSLAVYSVVIRFCAVVVAALAGFLVWNFPPAKIFMGDVGSYFLGFTFGYLPFLFPERMGPLHETVLLSVKWSEATHPVRLADFSLFVLLLFPFLCDTTVTLARRLSGKRPPFQPHREHLYQLLLRSGTGALRVDLFYLLLGIVMLSPLLIRFHFGNTLYAVASILLAGGIVTGMFLFARRLFNGDRLDR